MAERGPKIRRVDFRPDEYLSGVTPLTAEEQGVYWGICSLIYSRGGPIDDDLSWLCQHFHGMHWRTLARILDALAVKHGKITREDRKIACGRCIEELDRARSRVVQAQQNGALGGRPPTVEPVLEGGQEGRKHPRKTAASTPARLPQAPPQDGLEARKNKDLPKAAGFSGEKLTTNYQLPDKNPPRPPEAGGAQPAVSEAKPKTRRTRAVGQETPMPDGFALTADMRAFAERKCPGIDAEAEFERFCAHHNSHESQFKNWERAWQKWVLGPYAKVMKSPQRLRVSEGYGFGIL